MAYIFLKQGAKTSEKLRTSLKDNYTTGDNKYPTTCQEIFHYLEKHSKIFCAHQLPQKAVPSPKGVETLPIISFGRTRSVLIVERKDTHPHTALVKRKRIRIATMAVNQAKQAKWTK